MLKVFLAFIGVAILTLAGAILLLVWISSMTPIHVTEETEPAGAPPTAEEWVEQGALLLVVGTVEALYGAEWSTPDASRPGTPWDVSGVPDDIWIHTPILIDIQEDSVVVRPEAVETLIDSWPVTNLILALRGGDVGEDRYAIIDGQDREFELGDQVALVLSSRDREFNDPELTGTTFGDGWEFMGRYRVEDGTAVLQWGDETYEQPLDELVDEFQQASP